MFLKKAFTIATNYIIKNHFVLGKLRPNITVSQLSSKFIKTSAVLLFLSSTLTKCITEMGDSQPQIHEITKQQLVQYIHKDHSQEFVVIVYDKFKRLNQKQFGEELKPIIEECKNAKVGKVYLIDSKEKEHLNQIIRILKNIPNNGDVQDDENKDEKKKTFQCFYKSKFFNQAIELEKNNGSSLSKQIAQIRHFQVKSNNEKINQNLNDFINNPFLIDQTYVVKQCISEGQCVQSYKREIKKLIEGGMLSGKKDEFKFQLIIDQPKGILTSSSSEYVKNFIKNTQKLKGKSFTPNRKQQIYVFKKDLFGNKVSVYSEWLQKQGFNYTTSSDKFLMFIRPRINLITKMNTLPDLMWFLRTAKLNNQVSISLNNTLRFGKENKRETIQVLKLLYENFPKINYVIVNSQKVRQLLRHINADYKYVIFKQESNAIWKKQFLDLDKLELLPLKQEKEQLFNRQFKNKIASFIDHPQFKSFVQVEKELQINFQKLRNLREQQLKKISLKKYLIRVCRQNCHRYIDKNLLNEINSKLQQPINVYWIDSLTQNIGVQDGDYILKDGLLQNPQVFIRSS